jgi:hypothetical protein
MKMQLYSNVGSVRLSRIKSVQLVQSHSFKRQTNQETTASYSNIIIFVSIGYLITGMVEKVSFNKESFRLLFSSPC